MRMTNSPVMPAVDLHVLRQSKAKQSISQLKSNIRMYTYSETNAQSCVLNCEPSFLIVKYWLKDICQIKLGTAVIAQTERILIGWATVENKEMTGGSNFCKKH